ncbi:hypothetical protein GGI21_001264 [Coemansia aciculifera]|nr:hypothetical protein GGI21_001264 [Coemansia aciculifera]
MATQLTLDLPKCMTPDHLKHIALDILKLDRVGWMHINSLAVVEASRVCKHYAVLLDSNDSARNKVEHALQFFAQNLRNIVKLKFTVGHFEPIGALICEELACMYGGQLQILRAQDYAPLPLLELSRNIAVLELTLDDKASWKLPDVCGEMLRELKLSNVPQNFAWRRFRYDIFVRPIVFPRLTIVSLVYNSQHAGLTDDEIQSRVRSGARNCDQLCFPALKELVIYNCTPDCDLLYADTPFPELERVKLVGSFDNIRHCSRLKLTWVRDLKVEIRAPQDYFTTDVHDVANPLFTNICIGRSAALSINAPWFVIDTEATRWFNITFLSLSTVYYRTLCKLIARMPNLTTFETIYLELTGMQVEDFYADESLFCSMDPMLAWGEQLTTLFIGYPDKYALHEVRVCGIQALIVHAGALVQLAVSKDFVSIIKTVIDNNKERFVHLASVNVEGSGW